jgi:Skp family chaperone for outer membrane proteins
MKKVLITVLAAALCAGFVQNLHAVKLVKIGYVDVEEIFAAYPGAAEIRQKLKDEKDKLQVEIDRQKEAIARLERDYQLNSDRLSDDERQRREAEIEYKKEILLEAIDDSNKKLNTLKDELTKPIYLKIATVIQRVSAEKGYSFVFKKASDMILYVDKEYDLTKEVKQRISRELSIEERN